MHTSANDPYTAKAIFFDGQVHAPWAVESYSPEEQKKLDRLFAVTGPLAGLRILEPGCGTGRLTEVLAGKAGPEGRVVAMDISPLMIAEAHRRLSGSGNVNLILGPVETRIGDLGMFDQVICHQVFPHFLDQAAALAALSRILKPGGELVISHFKSSAEINDVHRKAGTAVAEDAIPSAETMRRWCEQSHLSIHTWQDDARGYLLGTRRTDAPG